MSVDILHPSDKHDDHMSATFGVKLKVQFHAPYISSTNQAPFPELDLFLQNLKFLAEGEWSLDRKMQFQKLMDDKM